MSFISKGDRMFGNARKKISTGNAGELRFFSSIDDNRLWSVNCEARHAALLDIINYGEVVNGDEEMISNLKEENKLLSEQVGDMKLRIEELELQNKTTSDEVLKAQQENENLCDQNEMLRRNSILKEEELMSLQEEAEKLSQISSGECQKSQQILNESTKEFTEQVRRLMKKVGLQQKTIFGLRSDLSAKEDDVKKLAIECDKQKKQAQVALNKLKMDWEEKQKSLQHELDDKKMQLKVCESQMAESVEMELEIESLKDQLAELIAGGDCATEMAALQKRNSDLEQVLARYVDMYGDMGKEMSVQAENKIQQHNEALTDQSQDLLKTIEELRRALLEEQKKSDMILKQYNGSNKTVVDTSQQTETALLSEESEGVQFELNAPLATEKRDKSDLLRTLQQLEQSLLEEQKLRANAEERLSSALKTMKDAISEKERIEFDMQMLNNDLNVIPILRNDLNESRRQCIELEDKVSNLEEQLSKWADDNAKLAEQLKNQNENLREKNDIIRQLEHSQLDVEKDLKEERKQLRMADQNLQRMTHQLERRLSSAVEKSLKSGKSAQLEENDEFVKELEATIQKLQEQVSEERMRFNQVSEELQRCLEEKKKEPSVAIEKAIANLEGRYKEELKLKDAEIRQLEIKVQELESLLVEGRRLYGENENEDGAEELREELMSSANAQINALQDEIINLQNQLKQAFAEKVEIETSQESELNDWKEKQSILQSELLKLKDELREKDGAVSQDDYGIELEKLKQDYESKLLDGEKALKDGKNMLDQLRMELSNERENHQQFINDLEKKHKFELDELKIRKVPENALEDELVALKNVTQESIEEVENKKQEPVREGDIEKYKKVIMNLNKCIAEMEKTYEKTLKDMKMRILEKAKCELCRFLGMSGYSPNAWNILSILMDILKKNMASLSFTEVCYLHYETRTNLEEKLLKNNINLHTEGKPAVSFTSSPLQSLAPGSRQRFNKKLEDLFQEIVNKRQLAKLELKGIEKEARRAKKTSEMLKNAVHKQR